jgi:hypothetical protein
MLDVYFGVLSVVILIIVLVWHFFILGSRLFYSALVKSSIVKEYKMGPERHSNQVQDNNESKHNVVISRSQGLVYGHWCFQDDEPVMFFRVETVPVVLWFPPVVPSTGPQVRSLVSILQCGEPPQWRIGTGLRRLSDFLIFITVKDTSTQDLYPRRLSMITRLSYHMKCTPENLVKLRLTF